MRLAAPCLAALIVVACAPPPSTDAGPFVREPAPDDDDYVDGADGGAAADAGAPRDAGRVDDAGAPDDGGIVPPVVVGVVGLVGPGWIDAPVVAVPIADGLLVGGRAEPDATIAGVPFDFPNDPTTFGFVARLGEDGSPTWALPITQGSGDCVASDIALVDDDAFAYAGQTDPGPVDGGTSFGPHVPSCPLDGTLNSYVAKASLDGVVAWARCFYAQGGTTFDYAADVRALGDGSVVALLHSEGDGLATWPLVDGGADLGVAPGGSEVLVRLAPSGDVLWALRVGDTTTEPVGMTVGDDDAIVVAAVSDGPLRLVDRDGMEWTHAGTSSAELFVVRFDPDGVVEAIQALGGPYGGWGQGGVDELADGGFVVAATRADGATSDVGDVHLLSAALVLQSSIVLEQTAVYDVAAVATGGYVLAGTAAAPLDLAGALLVYVAATGDATWRARATQPAGVSSGRVRVADDGVIAWAVQFEATAADAGPVPLTIHADVTTTIDGVARIDGAWILLQAP